MTKPGKPDPDQPEGDATPEIEPETEPKMSDTAKKAEPETDPEPLMAELEKAPPPPEEPVMPTAREAAAKRARPDGTVAPVPGLLRWSFYLALLSAVIGVVGGVFLLLNKQTLIDDLIENNTNADLTNEQIASGTTTLLWMLMIVTVVFGALLALFGYKAQEGVKKARTMMTVLTVLVVLFYFVLFTTPFGLLSALLALIAVALLYLPAASQYYRRLVV